MATLRHRIAKVLLVLTVGVLPFAAVDCDLEDGELEFDIDGLGRHGYDDYWYDDCYDDCWYEEEYYYYDDYYEPWDWWW